MYSKKLYIPNCLIFKLVINNSKQIASYSNRSIFKYIPTSQCNRYVDAPKEVFCLTHHKTRLFLNALKYGAPKSHHINV